MDRRRTTACATENTKRRTVGLNALLFGVEGLGTRKLPVEVWLDGPEPRPPLRDENDLAGAGGGKMQTSVVEEYYDFGTWVDVQAPPRNQTMDGSRLFSGERPPPQ